MIMPKTIQPVKLIAGFIFADQTIYLEARKQLEKKLGPIQFESDISEFSHTDYYRKEMGGNLRRRFVSFEKTVMPDELKRIKNGTNDLEKLFSDRDGNRKINIDPGTVSLANLILASTKNYSHRIYLGDTIYGEVTLIYKEGAFRPLEWTYPDYRSRETIAFIHRVRDGLKEEIDAVRRRG